MCMKKSAYFWQPYETINALNEVILIIITTSNDCKIENYKIEQQLILNNSVYAQES